MSNINFTGDNYDENFSEQSLPSVDVSKVLVGEDGKKSYHPHDDIYITEISYESIKEGEKANILLHIERRNEKGEVIQQQRLIIWANEPVPYGWGNDEKSTTGLKGLFGCYQFFMNIKHIAAAVIPIDEVKAFDPWKGITITKGGKKVPIKPELGLISKKENAEKIITERIFDAVFTNTAKWFVKVTEGGSKFDGVKLKFKFKRQSEEKHYIQIPKYIIMTKKGTEMKVPFIANVLDEKANSIKYSAWEISKGFANPDPVKKDKKAESELNDEFEDEVANDSTSSTGADDLPFDTTASANGSATETEEAISDDDFE